jgi:membrane protease YdiL (CAAX protease family)
LVFAIAWDGLTYLLDRPIIPEFMLRAYETAYFVPLLWLAIVIAAPLAEELFFRGFLFESVRYTRLGVTGAVVITSLLWAVIHLQYGPYEITTVFILGLILGVARLITGSIYTPIVMHGLVNLVATVEVAVYIHYFRYHGY